MNENIYIYIYIYIYIFGKYEICSNSLGKNIYVINTIQFEIILLSYLVSIKFVLIY